MRTSSASGAIRCEGALLSGVWNRISTVAVTAVVLFGLTAEASRGWAAGEQADPRWAWLTAGPREPGGGSSRAWVEADQRARQILARMSVEEKVGQIIQADVRRVTPDDIRRFHLGSVISGGGVYPGDDKAAPVAAWVALADSLYDASIDPSGGRTGVPLLWGTDAVHGHNNVRGATVFPHNIGLGATGNAELVRAIGEATAREVTATGIDWTFAPTLAVARDDRWSRTYESFSEEPERVADLGQAVILGLQGGEGGPTIGSGTAILATAKHFIGDGGTRDGRDQGDTVTDEAALLSLHGRPYVAAIDAGVLSIMVSYSSWNGRRLHAHRYLLTDVLKQRLGFEGFLIGDWNGHGKIPGCTPADCPEAINAGIDMIMVPEHWRAFYANTLQRVRQGDIPMERLDDAVLRILKVKLRVGLFEAGRPSARRGAGEQSWLGHPRHRALARQAVRQSLVLLKNENGILPLDPKQAILVSGSAADDIARQSGGWTLSWQGTGNSNVDFPGATSIRAGIAEAVNTAGGRVLTDTDWQAGMRPDAAIVVFGEEPYAEMRGDIGRLDFEAGDRPTRELMQRLRRQGIPVVAVFLTGRPRWVNPEINSADAFVVAWLPGSEGGGVADVLLRAADGRVQHEFQGRLAFSWPRYADQGAVNVGDADYQPQFAIGYGLRSDVQVHLSMLDESTATPWTTEADALPLFKAGPVAPFQLQVGDGATWQIPVFDTSIEPSGGQPLAVHPTEKAGPQDGRRIDWPGARTGQVSLSTLVPVDITPFLGGAGVLAIDIRVDQQPAGEVFLGMECAPDDPQRCGSPVPIGRLLRERDAGTWNTIQVDVRCFVRPGSGSAAVVTPFRLLTDSPATLSLADIRLRRAGGAPADLTCES